VDVPRSPTFDLLKRLGWNDLFEASYVAVASEDSSPARVVGEEKGFYRLMFSPVGEPGLAEISGKFRHGAKERRDFPTVGDWVSATPARGAGSTAVIHQIVARQSCLTRKEAGESTREQLLAANVDTAFIMTSANQDMNPRRLERYLLLASDGGAEAVILLNKIDLTEHAPELAETLSRAAPGIAIHAISAKQGQGLEALAGYLALGRTSVLLGSSGVGKSTLTNRLLQREAMKTAEVRAHDDRGRHTTTSRHLFVLPQGGMLIDTPGLRELQLTEEQSEALQSSFADIEELARRCKFTNCQHAAEPGCRIQAAIASGELPRDRWESYLKLAGELGGGPGRARDKRGRRT
jgi:ribosome biogenesis GTPase